MFGRYCRICGSFISLKDVRDWLKENDPEKFEELKKEYYMAND